MTTLDVIENPVRVERSVVIDQYRKHVNRGFATLASISGAPVEVRSAGPFVFDEDGSRYLDCGGYGVFLLGHGHPRVVGAVAQQLYRHPLSARGILDPCLARACTAIADIAPPDMPYVSLTNSGAEATELALKLARAGGFRRLIAMKNGFHGKTLGALSVTGRDRFRSPALPLLPDVSFVAFGDELALETELLRSSRPAAVILEPVQGEGGVVLPPAGYLRRARELCTTNGALLIVDEIQTGLGRIGTWWGCQQEGIKPDLLLTGKILSGGVVPVGAVISSAEVFEVMNVDPLLHSSTFSGNPLAAVAATETIAVIQDERLIERSARIGAELLRDCAGLVSQLSPEAIPSVRGRGMLIGLECRDPSVAADLLRRLMERRILVSYSLNAGSVVRLTPPATFTDANIDFLLSGLQGSLTQLSKR